MSVFPEQRGKGTGQKLLDHVIEEAGARGVVCLSVKPVARNEEAIASIHRAGFRTPMHIQLFT
jgi:GNAT superfamily N-acetyltransferase